MTEYVSAEQVYIKCKACRRDVGVVRDIGTRSGDSVAVTQTRMWLEQSAATAVGIQRAAGVPTNGVDLIPQALYDMDDALPGALTAWCRRHGAREIQPSRVREALTEARSANRCMTILV